MCNITTLDGLKQVRDIILLFPPPNLTLATLGECRDAITGDWKERNEVGERGSRGNGE